MVKSEELLKDFKLSFKKEKKKQVSLMIRESLIKQLKEVAEEENTSMSEIINHLLLVYLKQKKIETL